MDLPSYNRLGYLPANFDSFTTILEGIEKRTVRSPSLTFIPLSVYYGFHDRTLHLFIRDGTMYFLIICMTNLLNTLIYFVSVRHKFTFHIIQIRFSWQ